MIQKKVLRMDFLIHYHHESNADAISEYLSPREESIESLKNHPLIEKAFRKYNTVDTR